MRLWALGPRSWRDSRWTLFGVVAGVGLSVAATVVAVDTTVALSNALAPYERLARVATLFVTTPGSARVGGEGSEGLFDEDEVEALERIPGVTRVTAERSLAVSVQGAGIATEVPLVSTDLRLGSDSRLELRRGRLPSEGANEVLASLNFEHQFAGTGSRIALSQAGHRVPVTVVGVVGAPGFSVTSTPGQRPGALFARSSFLRSSFDLDPQMSDVVIAVDPRTDSGEVAAKVHALLPGTLSRDQRREYQDLARSARSAQPAVAILALLAAAASTIAVRVLLASALKREKYAIARLLGATRHQLLVVAAAQVAFPAMVGLVGGVVGGVALSGVVRAAAIREAFSTDAAGAPVGWIGVGLVLGLGVAAAAAWTPIRHATSRTSDPSRRTRSHGVLALCVATPSLIAGFAWRTTDGLLAMGPIVLQLIGFGALAVACLGPFGQSVRRAARAAGIPALELAASKLARRPGRRAQTVGVLAVVLVAAFATGSVRASFDAAADRTRRSADLVVATGARSELTELRGALANHEAVQAVSLVEVKTLVVESSEGAVTLDLMLVDPDEYHRVEPLVSESGDALALDRLAVLGAVALDATAARAARLRVDDQVEFGGFPFEIVGVFRPTPGGRAFASQETGARIPGAPVVSQLRIRVSQGSSATVASELRESASESLAVQTVEELLTRSEDLVHTWIRAALGALTVSALLGLAAIGATLFIDVIERRRAIAIERILGSTVGQQVAALAIESALLVLAAVLVALPGSVAVAWSVLQIPSFSQLLGPPALEVPLPWTILVAACALSVAVAVVLVPARHIRGIRLPEFARAHGE